MRWSANAPIVVTALFRILQTYVYVNFGDYYIDGDSSSQWSVLYNAVALTCGSVSFVAGALCLCCVAARRPSSAYNYISAFAFYILRLYLRVTQQIGIRVIPQHPDGDSGHSVHCRLFHGIRSDRFQRRASLQHDVVGHL